MMRMLKNWFRNRFGAPEEQPQPPVVTGSYRQHMANSRQKASEQDSGEIDLEPRLHGTIETIGPGKNVFVRSEQGAENPDALDMVDELSLESDTADGIDPYNTGRFDRSKKWDSRSKK